MIVRTALLKSEIDDRLASSAHRFLRGSRNIEPSHPRESSNSTASLRHKSIATDSGSEL